MKCCRWTVSVGSLAGLALAAVALAALRSPGQPGAAAAGAAESPLAQAAQQPDAPRRAQQPQQPRRQQAGQAQRQRQAGQQPAPPPPSADQAGVPVLSFGDSYDDFASVAQAPDGSLYAAYAAYFDGHDQIRLHKQLPDGAWSTRTHVPLVQARADIWMPQVAVDRHNRVWLVWCEQTDQTRTASGNWDVYARWYDGDNWGPPLRLSDDPKPDINPHVTVDADHNIYLVWQAHPDNDGDIMFRRYDGAQWSPPLAVTSGPGADWYPQVAVDRQGVAWIAFDSYRNGDYDVFLTSVKDGRPGELITLAASRYYEAHPTVACTPDGRVWVAWEQGGYNWGKDQGYWLGLSQRGAAGPAEAHPAGGGIGTPLGSTREVKVAAWHDGRLWAAPPPAQSLAADARGPTAMAGLVADGKGRLWLRFRHQRRGGLARAGRFTRYWTENVTHLTDEGWSTAQELAGSNGRISVFNRAIAAAGGGLWVAYSADQRGPANFHQPVHDQVLVAKVAPPEAGASSPQLEPYQPPAAPADATPWDVERERRQVAAVRAHRASSGGQPLRIVRGDLHRHTELSWDVGPGNDGSYLDFYRYMIDVAEMDFGALTDHQGGGHYPYYWWLTEKSADMYYLAPRFVPLYGYERSARFPNGHRNVFHAYRGVPIFPFQLTLDQRGVFPGVGSGALAGNDTKLLYEYLHKTRGVAISHTSGTDSMGTDWRDNDPLIEPVVEIYQGARNSYEVVGGPRVHDASRMAPEQAPGGYQEQGMVWNALAKGYRLGTITSSDHGSTHISYALVYVPENTREAILEAIRRRHTYGATDNLIVESWANGRFMGEEFQSDERPSLQLKATGTGSIARVDLVRNNRYIYTTSPLKDTIDLKYTDMEPEAGLNYYYFRIQQDDGEIAWASPVWIHYKGK